MATKEKEIPEQKRKPGRPAGPAKKVWSITQEILIEAKTADEALKLHFSGNGKSAKALVLNVTQAK